MKTVFQVAIAALLFLGVSGCATTDTVHGLIMASGDQRPADEVVTGYAPDCQGLAWVSGQGMASSTSIATLTSTVTGQFIVQGKPTISVGGRFDTAAQTCKVRLLYEYSKATGSKTDVNAIPTNLSFPLTLTASSYTDGAGKFVAPPVFFDSLGATHVYVVVDTPPTFNQVAFWVGSN